MKIKIFLASSKELKEDRVKFGNLIRQLNIRFKKRNIELDLFEWEDYDASFNNRRKQDEYNEQIEGCDMFVALFHKSAGKFTIEEFQTAVKEQKLHGKPKIYVFFRKLDNDNEISKELRYFKDQLEGQDDKNSPYKHFSNNYESTDSLHFQFVMQLLLLDGNSIKDIGVENGEIALEDIVIAKMSNLKFATSNSEYQDSVGKIRLLCRKIREIREALKSNPEIAYLQNELKEKEEELKKERDLFEKYQESLFSTAVKVAKLQNQEISERLRKATIAFNEGNISEVQVLLANSEADARRIQTEYYHYKELSEMRSKDIELLIEELLFKISCLNSRLGTAKEQIPIYKQVDQLMQDINYNLDSDKYIDFLTDYVDCLDGVCDYNGKLKIILKIHSINEKLHGKNSSWRDYIDISNAYGDVEDYENALTYSLKYHQIARKIYGAQDRRTALSYSHLGNCYDCLGNFKKAISCFEKAYKINNNPLYVRLKARVYSHMKEYEEAIKNYKKCLKLFGNNTWTPPIPDILVKIGQNYMCLSKETVALEYYYEALRLCEDHYPLFSGHVVRKYNLISQYYDKVGNSQKQLDFNNSAIEKYTSQLGPKHEAIASFLYNISIAYIKLNKYDEAITSLKKALIIIEDHPNDYPTKDMIIKQMELIDGKNNEGV